MSRWQKWRSEMAIMLKLPDIDMPNNCCYCPIESPLCDLYCLFDKACTERHQNCPLVEFPTKYNQDNEDVTEQ